MSHQLVTMLAGIMPEEMLIEKLEESLAKYKISGELKDLGFPCMLIATRLTVNDTEGGVTEVIKEMENLERADKLLKPDKS